ncbi:hypothetical protein CRV24_005234 [Beauveria bassiana]|nr:hypothetical protein CRV24_005234 [Beauveria bassiana]KAH8709831.1 hypothetical protein HC256_009740 [Beauveria bassiana]
MTPVLGIQTFEEAKNKDFNCLERHKNVMSNQGFLSKLWSYRDVLAGIPKHHLRLEEEASCRVFAPSEWMSGSFNICIPIEVKSRSFSGQVIVRCPLPSKLAESRYPGTVDEKMSTEIASYVFMQKECPGIRIPRLHGFAFGNVQCTHQEHLSLYRRIVHSSEQWIRRILRLDSLSQYAPHKSAIAVPTQYLLLEYIRPETGRVLSESWEEHNHDPAHRRALFRGIAHTILSLAKVPQPRIGSFHFNDNCTIALKNRPLLTAEIILESDGIPRSIEPAQTYDCTEPFVSDLISLHDDRLRYDRSAADDEVDCRSQMAIRALLRTISHHFIQHEYRRGPFLLQFTDFHQSNVIVDEDWNIQCLIDLEWLCALPVESLRVPYWLTGRGIDELIGDHLTEYEALRREFMVVFEEELSGVRLAWPLTRIMQESWDSKAAWFWSCLFSVNAAFFLITDHLCPKYTLRLSEAVEEMLSSLWSDDTAGFIEKKVRDYATYSSELSRFYAQ